MRKRKEWEKMTPKEKTDEFVSAFLQALVILIITLLILFVIQ